jgi:subfamily B ATP-binding cassette protein MsbA
VKKDRPLIFKLYSTNKRWSVGILVVSITGTFLNSIGLIMLVPILFQTFNLNFSQNLASAITKQFDKYLFWLPGGHGPWLLFFLLLLFVAKNALTVLRVRLVSDLTKRHMLSIRSQLLTHILSKDLHFFIKTGSGAILTQLNVNVDKVASLMVDVIEIFGMAFQLVSYAVVLTLISWKLCLICAVCTAPLILLTRITARKARSLSMDQVHSYNQLAQTLSDLLHGIRFVKLSGRESDHVQWVNSISEQILTRVSKMQFLYNISGPIIELAALGVLLAMISSLTFLGLQSTVDAEKFFSYLLILFRALPLFSNVANKRVEISGNTGALNSLQSVLRDMSFQEYRQGTERFSRLRKDIEFRKVSFAYPETDKMVLNEISFKIERGSSVALVGPSGSGKSTLVDLLLGFYHPTSGEILIDGIDYRNFIRNEYTSKIGLVPQEATMFFSTIRENLLYLSPKASEIEIWRALDQADLADFISNLPNGIDTPVGEKGVMLSGGQKQRLSIARSLLQSPEILIFDEATSSLDSISETKIVDSIKRASVGRTTITIAHRLATILHCSNVILIEHGWLVEQGSVNALLSKASRFKKFAEAQNLKLTA